MGYSRREFMKLLSAAAATGVLQPKFTFAQGMPGGTMDVVHVFLGGGACPRYLFPYLSGALHAEFTSGRIRSEASYPRTGTLQTIPLSKQVGRANPIGFNSNFSTLDAAIKAVGCGAAIVTEYGITERVSFSHDVATRQFIGGAAGPDGDTSGFKKGWLAKLIDQYRMPALSVWGIGNQDRLSFNAETASPIVLSDISSFNFQDRNFPNFPFDGGAVNGPNDSVFARSIAKELAQVAHPEIPFDAAFRDTLNGVHSSVALLQGTIKQISVNDSFFGIVNGVGSTASIAMRDIAKVLHYTNFAAAQNIKSSSKIISTAIGGFDAHQSIAGSYPYLIQTLSQALAGLVRQLSAFGLLNRTAIVVETEFGRTTRENGTGGLDHANASYCLVLGGKVSTGVYGPEATLQNIQTANIARAEVPLTALHRKVFTQAGFATAGLDQVYSDKLRNEDTIALPLFV